jgi:hypothetical protein
MSDLVDPATRQVASGGVPVTSPIVRAGIVAAVLTGVLTTVHDVLDARSPGIDQGFGWSLVHFGWLTTMTLAMLGLTVLQWPALDRFGRIATRFAVAACGVMAGFSAIETVSLYGRTVLPADDPALPVLVAILTVFACYVIGIVLFAVATLRAGLLPRAAAVLLLVAVPVKMFFGDGFGPLALLGLAFAVLGITAAVRVHRPQPTRV